MNITVEQRRDDLLLTLGGRLTSENVQPLNTEIKKMLERYGIPYSITIDMRDVVYINASALRALYHLVYFIYSRGGYIHFYGIHGMTKDFMDIAGVSYSFPFTLVEA